MSVTVEDLLNLPSLRKATVLGGRGGLKKVVSSISVLESVDPGMLVNGLFYQDEFYASEIVITGFLNCIDDIECQCLNIRQLAAGGEVGLIVFYVGVYLPKIDQRLIDLADELDFALIQMPVGQKCLRYSDVIRDVTECIFNDRAKNDSIVSDILARVSALPPHLRTVHTALKMLSDRLLCSVILADSSRELLNLIAWPQDAEPTIRENRKAILAAPSGLGGEPALFLPGGTIYHIPVQLEKDRRMELYLVKEGSRLSQALQEQVSEVVRICVNIWGQEHEHVAIRELVRSILQDDPIKMRRLAEIFRIDIASIHEMWIICGRKQDSAQRLARELSAVRDMVRTCCDIVFADMHDGALLLFASTPVSSKMADTQIQAVLDRLLAADDSLSLTRCSSLRNTTEVRKAYLAHLEYLPDAQAIFPQRRRFTLSDLVFVEECRRIVDAGEEEAFSHVARLRSILSVEDDGWDMLGTLGSYLLDNDARLSETAKALHLHVNTVKYRLKVLTDLLGYKPGKMPDSNSLYHAIGVHRLLEIRAC